MSERPTPETDSYVNRDWWTLFRANEHARELERERDEAREELRTAVQERHDFHWELLDAIRERDEAREKIERQADRIRYLEGATNHAKGTPLSVAVRERDEAREELHDIRLNLGDDADGYTLLHAVCVIQNERDEMREKLSAAWQSLRDSQDEVLRLTFENRELRNLKNE